MKKICLDNGSIVAHKDVFILAAATTFEGFKTLMNKDENRAMIAIKHAIDFYVGQCTGDRLIRHFRHVMDLPSGQPA